MALRQEVSEPVMLLVIVFILGFLFGTVVTMATRQSLDMENVRESRHGH